MSSNEIVALRCPSCGEGITQPSREMPFGAEFRCDGCDITSVLIVNRDLVPLSTLQKLGEKVCAACGRIAHRDARFCQEGHTLVRPCIKCLKEFAVDHPRCDFCGWIQIVKPGTEDGEALAFQDAVSDLASPSPLDFRGSLGEVIAGGSSASRADISAAVSAIHSRMIEPRPRYTSECWKALGSLGTAAMPAILSIINDPSFKDKNLFCEDLVNTLRNLKPASQQTAPILRQRLEEIWTSRWSDNHTDEGIKWNWLFSCLGTVSPEDALSLCSRSLDEWDKNGSKVNERILLEAFALGKEAIPKLEKFCGFLSGRRGKACSKVISALREGQSFVTLLDAG